jgi:hypothetical protein
LDPINGLNPNEELHESFIDINTRFGFPMNATLKFQLNLQLMKTETFLPICWFEISVDKLPKIAWENFNHTTFSINTLLLFQFIVGRPFRGFDL